jgi:putative transposase
MPSKNQIKIYVEESYYHIYNRGVEKREIFLHESDYGVFLSYLKEYLLPKDQKGLTQVLSDPNSSARIKDKTAKLLRLNNFNQEITLLAYCLMPNHFHFLVKQKNMGSIDKFMNSLGTRYTMYFNRKYKRVGPLYQGVYKAILVDSEGQFLHLSRYIHKQALASKNQPCSYPEYIGTRKTTWVNPEEVLEYFSKTNPEFTYEIFVKESDSVGIIQDITIEES